MNALDHYLANGGAEDFIIMSRTDLERNFRPVGPMTETEAMLILEELKRVPGFLSKLGKASAEAYIKEHLSGAIDE